jgi:hypothetical protein
MQALYNYFDEHSKVAVEDFIVHVEKLPGNGFKFTLTSMLGKKLEFHLTRSGLTPLDNRGMLG